MPIAFVPEKTANTSYIGTWDDDIESIPPFWSINHVVRRKNMFIHPDLSATQRPFHDPRVYYINSLYTGVDYFHTWRHYKTLSEEIEALLGTIDMNNTFSMMSSVYRGETDIVIKMYKSLGWTEPIRVFHIWAAYPETGDIVISFADGEQEAQFTPIHHFNLYELLEQDGPP